MPCPALSCSCLSTHIGAELCIESPGNTACQNLESGFLRRPLALPLVMTSSSVPAGEVTSSVLTVTAVLRQFILF